MKELFTRRRIVIAGGGLAAVAGAGVLLLHRRHAPSPYDDLLDKLDDRDADAQIGEAVLANIDEFDAKAVADDLRGRLERHSLAETTAQDAGDGRLIEAAGWVLPETLALLCALAAKAAA